MKRVLVIGSGGAGKSTFSRRLAEVTGLPLVHLDRLFWKPGWVETDRSKWIEIMAQVLDGERWIIDGNYSGTLEMRLAACDTVIFLDMPRLLCTYRVLKRVVKYKKGSRPDMADGCYEQFDPTFLKFVWTYPERSKPNVLRRLENVRDTKTIITLRSRREVESLLSGLSAGIIAINGNKEGRVHDQYR
jgi:adenylate kinase family enzyme